MVILDSMVQKALYCAAEWHREQSRKGVVRPYIGHPFSVGTLLVETAAQCRVSLEPEVVAAAFLHDVLEDTCVTAETLETAFSPVVLKLVQDASEDDKTLSWRVRKMATVEKLEQLPARALLVPFADKIHNLSEVYAVYLTSGSLEASFKGFNADATQQQWYYGTLQKVFEERVSSADEKGRYTPLLKAFLALYTHYYTSIFLEEGAQ